MCAIIWDTASNCKNCKSTHSSIRITLSSVSYTHLDAATLLRGYNHPLIVVDGFARPLSYLNTEEIESVTVLKDGAATAVWGTRGANGVILITTKRGQYNTKMQIGASYKFGMDFPINQPKFANGYEYASALNEALYYDGLEPQYTREELDAFRNGSNRDLYADTDWMKEGPVSYTHLQKSG